MSVGWVGERQGTVLAEDSIEGKEEPGGVIVTGYKVEVI